MRKIALNVALTLAAATATAWLLWLAFDIAGPDGATLGGIIAILTLVAALAAAVGTGINLYLTHRNHRRIPNVATAPPSAAPASAAAPSVEVAVPATLGEANDHDRSLGIDIARSRLLEHGALMKAAVDDAIARNEAPDYRPDGILVPGLLKLLCNLSEADAASAEHLTLPVIFWGAGRTQDVDISGLRCSEMLIARHEFAGGQLRHAEITLRCGPGPIAFNGTTFANTTLRAVDAVTGAVVSGRLSFVGCHADPGSTLNGFPITALIKA